MVPTLSFYFIGFDVSSRNNMSIPRHVSCGMSMTSPCSLVLGSSIQLSCSPTIYWRFYVCFSHCLLYNCRPHCCTPFREIRPLTQDPTQLQHLFFRIRFGITITFKLRGWQYRGKLECSNHKNVFSPLLYFTATKEGSKLGWARCTQNCQIQFVCLRFNRMGRREKWS